VSADRGRAGRPRIGFVLEQSLGHVTHADNLRSIISDDVSIQPCWLPIPFAVSGWRARLPVYGSNWTVRSGMRARRAIRQAQAAAPLDALFIHTQVPAVLSSDWLAKVPTVVSLDATPRQYDSLGAHYGHAVGGPRVEQVKWWLNRRCFARAAAIVSWSEWAKAGVVAEYDVEPEKVTVLAPGVRCADWAVEDGARPSSNSVRILFVGADLERKGGLVLLDAFRRLRRDAGGDHTGVRPLDVRLDLVTQTHVDEEPGVAVHRGLRSNSQPLKDLYRAADIFCLPTMGDCLPMVLSEAGAAGLPLVSTAVGAIPEIVRDGETGLLVPLNDAGALAVALRRLVLDAALRRRLGTAACAHVRAQFDAEKNAHALLQLLREIASPGPSGAGDG
jgi:glycosyltransferase involved in cell wall biosynthesis